MLKSVKGTIRKCWTSVVVMAGKSIQSDQVESQDVQRMDAIDRARQPTTTPRRPRYVVDISCNSRKIRPSRDAPPRRGKIRVNTWAKIAIRRARP